MISMTRSFSQHKGVTLAELLIVVTIVVILGLITLVGINPMTQILRGYDTRRKADLAKIKIALENYYSDHECYPVFSKDSNGKPTYTCDSDILSPYLNSIPCDPSTKKPYTIFLNPPDAACPSQYAVYAQVYSFFDKESNKIQDCKNTYAVYSSDMSSGTINYGCSQSLPCTSLYACRNYTCMPISIDDVNKCHQSMATAVIYCSSDCNYNGVGSNPCENPNNQCPY